VTNACCVSGYRNLLVKVLLAATRYRLKVNKVFQNASVADIDIYTILDIDIYSIFIPSTALTRTLRTFGLFPKLRTACEMLVTCYSSQDLASKMIDKQAYFSSPMLKEFQHCICLTGAPVWLVMPLFTE
jgi:hypothetical protein